MKPDFVIFSSVIRVSGFDGFVSPNWLMVPLRGALAPVSVRHGRNARFAVHPSSRAVIREQEPGGDPAKPDEVHLYIEGLEAGAGHITATNNDGNTRLNYNVFRPQTLNVHCFFIDDDGSRTGRAGDARSMIETISNEIYSPQVNVRLTPIIHNTWVRIPGVSFSEKTQSADEIDTIWDRLRSHARGHTKQGEASVFFVQRWRGRDRKTKDGKDRDVYGTADNIPGMLCIVEDMPSVADHTLLVAHELGHVVGAHHTKKSHKLKAKAMMHPTLCKNTTVQGVTGNYGGQSRILRKQALEIYHGVSRVGQRSS